jgi:hypothetical protein
MASSVATVFVGLPVEQEFVVSRSLLERSSVIRDWFANPETRSPNLWRGNSLYFPGVEAQVFQSLIQVLEQGFVPSDVETLLILKLMKLCLALG